LSASIPFKRIVLSSASFSIVGGFEHNQPDSSSKLTWPAHQSKSAQSIAALQSRHHPKAFGATTLLSQCFFKAMLCFGRERCVRGFADFFGKLGADFATVILTNAFYNLDYECAGD
jgi:hypothetical protein